MVGAKEPGRHTNAGRLAVEAVIRQPTLRGPLSSQPMRLTCLMTLAATADLQAAPAARESYAADVRPLLEKYCGDCHMDGAEKGELNLDSYTDEASIRAGRKTWASVHFNLDTWLMPPEKKPQPTAEERERLTLFIDRILNPYDPDNPDPGRVTIRRLNRVEYNNTMRDLLGVDIKPANEFPEDDTGYGFDTIGDVLALPPILMERYLSAAERVLDAAIPAAAKPPAKVSFAGGELRGEGGINGPRDGIYSLATAGAAGMRHEFPAAGEYAVRCRVFASQAGGEKAKVELRAGKQRVTTAEVNATERAKPQTVTGKFQVDAAGQRRVEVRFLNDFYDAASGGDRNVGIVSLEIEGPLSSDSPGPSGDAARRIFGSDQSPAETEPAVRAILTNFASRAYRRTALPAEIDRLADLFNRSRKQGGDFRSALKLAMQAVLISPYFLFRTEWQPEPNNPKQIVDISEFALATRLSYFLWSSMPDDELLSLAHRNELRKTLAVQMQRMLKDPKSRALAQNFGGQWLETRTLDAVQPDAKKFRFPPPLRAAMKLETEELFWHLQQENRSVLEFVTADYTFVNERLARHYGIPGVSGDQFRRVGLPENSLRRGVLTHGSVLTLTSDPTRTSPVKRGRWLLENILGIPPPPPPPNVPPLDDEKSGPVTGTVRQRLETHRTKPGCASCHALIDPLGFGLENFDAIGAFRNNDSGLPLDTSGTLTTGQKFGNAVELAGIIAKDRRDAFTRNLISKMLTYALGRGMTGSDRPAVDGILTRMQKEGYSFHSLLLGIVESVPFQKRRGDAFVPKTKPAPSG